MNVRPARKVPVETGLAQIQRFSRNTPRRRGKRRRPALPSDHCRRKARPTRRRRPAAHRTRRGNPPVGPGVPVARHRYRPPPRDDDVAHEVGQVRVRNDVPHLMPLRGPDITQGRDGLWIQGRSRIPEQDEQGRRDIVRLAAGQIGAGLDCTDAPLPFQNRTGDRVDIGVQIDRGCARLGPPGNGERVIRPRLQPPTPFAADWHQRPGIEQRGIGGEDRLRVQALDRKGLPRRGLTACLRRPRASQNAEQRG